MLVTSHSPDLLDDQDIPIDSILAVLSTEGRRRLGLSTLRVDQCFVIVFTRQVNYSN